MFSLPPEFSERISAFSDLFTSPSFNRVKLLLLGALLTKGKRTICSILRTLGLSDIKNWSAYHYVLSQAKWSALAFSKRLLSMLIGTFSTDKTLVIGMDETLERRWGKKIKARGIYRDAVRSSKSHFVKCSGLRWLSVMLIVPITWAGRLWALPFLTILAPSSGYAKQQGKRHKTIGDWARQICFLLYRWLPDYHLIMLADGNYANRDLIGRTRHLVTWITPLTLKASLYDFPPVIAEGGKRPKGRPPKKGKKQVSLKNRLEQQCTSLKWQKCTFSHWYGVDNKTMEFCTGTAIWYRGGQPAIPIRWVLIRDPKGVHKTIALLCTDLTMSAKQIIGHYIKRWNVEVTFAQVRAHLGVETQRQWSDLAILRTTPSLLCLYSFVALWANDLQKVDKLHTAQTSWYKKDLPTFSDAIASVRSRIQEYSFSLQSKKKGNCEENKRLFIKHLAFIR